MTITRKYPYPDGVKSSGPKITEEFDQIIEAVNTNEGNIAAEGTKNSEQDDRLSAIETKDLEQDGRLDSVEDKDSEQDGRLDTLETSVSDNEADIEGKVSNLAGTGRTTETVKGNADNLTTHKSSSDHDGRYYAKVEVDGKINNLAGTGRTTETIKGNADNLAAHKSSGDHDARYYRDTEVDTFLSALKGVGYTSETLKGLADLITGLQTQINNLNTTFSTDAERIAAINDIINQFTIADDDLETLINNKANSSDVYTKTEVDAKTWGTSSIIDRAITSIKVGLQQIKNEHLENKSVTSDKLADSLLTSLDDVIINARFEALETAQYTPEIYNYSDIISAGEGQLEDGTPVDYEVVDGKIGVGLKGLTLKNEVINGDFSDGTDGWTGTYSTLSASSKILSITGTGATAYPYCKTLNLGHAIATDKLFLYSMAKVPSECNEVRLYTYRDGDNGSLLFFIPPVTEMYQEFYGILTYGYDAQLAIGLQHRYADASTANGKVMQVDGNAGVFAINMTRLGIEDYTEEQMLELVKGGYFEGVKSTSPHVRYKSISANMFDNSKNVSGKYYLASGSLVDDDDSQCSLQKIKVESGVTYRASKGVSYITFDKKGNFLARDTGIYTTLSFTSEIGYISLFKYSSGLDYLDTLQFVKDTTLPTVYVPYTENFLYLNGGDEPIRSLPSASDVIREKAVGGHEKVKRSDELTYTGNEVEWTGFYTLDNRYYIRINGWDTANNGLTTYTNGSLYANNGLHTFSYGSYIAAVPDDTFGFVLASGTLYFVASKTYIDANYTADLAGLKNYIVNNPITLTYQLATEVITPIESSGMLTGHSSGTVYKEHIIPEISWYDSGCFVTNINYPIKAFDYIRKVDEDTGVETDLDVATAVLAVDGLSFTHPDLIKHDLVSWDYVPDVESTIGETITTYPINNKAQVDSNTKAVGVLNKEISNIQRTFSLLRYEKADKPRSESITLNSADWVVDGSYYKIVISDEKVTTNTRVDIALEIASVLNAMGAITVVSTDGGYTIYTSEAQTSNLTGTAYFTEVM